MKMIVTADNTILSDSYVPEAIYAHPTQNVSSNKYHHYFDEMAKIFRHQRQHKDVLSMMRECKIKHRSAFKITSTLSSRVMFKKRE